MCSISEFPWLHQPLSRLRHTDPGLSIGYPFVVVRKVFPFRQICCLFVHAWVDAIWKVSAGYHIASRSSIEKQFRTMDRDTLAMNTGDQCPPLLGADISVTMINLVLVRRQVKDGMVWAARRVDEFFPCFVCTDPTLNLTHGTGIRIPSTSGSFIHRAILILQLQS